MAEEKKTILLKISYPESEEGRDNLQKRVAQVHADFVSQTIAKMQVSAAQKEALWNRITQDARIGSTSQD